MTKITSIEDYRNQKAEQFITDLNAGEYEYICKHCNGRAFVLLTNGVVTCYDCNIEKKELAVGRRVENQIVFEPDFEIE